MSFMKGGGCAAENEISERDIPALNQRAETREAWSKTTLYFMVLAEDVLKGGCRAGLYWLGEETAGECLG